VQQEFQEFSKQQHKALRALFDQLDRNHNGLIHSFSHKSNLQF
jgi:Ca2+-binding EF-hand superfamily protein